MISFRTETKHYIRKAAAVAVITLIALLLNSRFPSFALWVLYLVLVVFCCGSLTSLFRTHLTMSDAELQGWGNGEDLYARWSEIAYARREEEKPGKYWLVVATQDTTFAMPLALLDAERIWQEVQHRAPQEAFAEDAADRLETIQIEAWEKRVGAMKGPFTLAMGRRFIWLLMLGVLGWGIVGILAQMVAPPEWAVGATVCVSVAMLLTLVFFLSMAHTLHVDAEGLTIRTITGYFQMKWAEIEKVRADPGNSVVVYEGKGKRLVTAPYILGGNQKQATMEFVTYQMRQREVPITREGRLIALPARSSKSARVKIERKRV
jgi:hypothetical protein